VRKITPDGSTAVTTASCVSCPDRSGVSSAARAHNPAYVSIRQHTSAYVSIRQHT
jgi:hypothetical protein